MELQVTNSPFNQEQADLLNRLLPTLTGSQASWLSGYLAALHGSAAAIPVQANLQTAAVPETAAAREVTILFGSQTGNCSGLAQKISKKLTAQGAQVTVSSMSDFKPNNLKKVQNLLIVVSTHGEGEPPDNAISFYEFLHGKRAPQLDGMSFSILALGDTSYEFFCQTGKDFDKRLEELGGKRIADRVDCDVDFDEPADEWMNEVLKALSAADASGISGTPGSPVTGIASETESEYSRTHPFHAEILENLNLNGRGSDRETRHVEISLDGSGLQYEPGDSLGIYPENHPDLVDDLIQTMGWNPQESITISKHGDQLALREALLRHYEISVLTKPLIAQVAELSDNQQLKELLASGHEQELKGYIEERDLLDLVLDYQLQGITAQAFAGILRKLPARLYSIASSSKAYPDEVHVTVRSVRYDAHGRDRYGVCSVQLAERLQSGDSLPVYIQHNPNFRLPVNPDTPIIMIGPGTGVAPFRAFLGDREESGAEGKTWLFYGDQHFSTDFLYQTEWQRWLKDGVLSRMDVAFSRDTDQKVYVQHRMFEKSRELYEWLQEGACVYVCGDEKKMAHDVHSTLAAILEQEGGFSKEAAAEYLLQMQQEKRYQRDVY
ncbi:assimilatory sulfite reductase (NADPH) flavoprotein subunit [Paenibacillus sp. HJL G12]|uniref:assimilatory sulfite reductase (NADPH) n=1 Tax=Paenibacillus dendrobii TaxID=2691084 RepID=A0A7X3LEX6_9BACL|nr:assimilatory sulfite reductase (NADPH) flavoprotein subunit [Paenibacillus dendrobii]MWV42996.1 assimilatory sulfite reductase (NADPH) flavoprotein subunit [Paenibacillus dendrobii]